MRALIVDDSRAMRALLKSMLRDLGYEVAEAAHGLEGLDRLAERSDWDVALVDWNMPEMDGIEFVKELRRRREYAELRVMMVTAELDMSKMARALAAGADEYAGKPLTRQAMAEKLALLGLEPAT
jgi:two-component system chemotaxis response regulator CheY